MGGKNNFFVWICKREINRLFAIKREFFKIRMKHNLIALRPKMWLEACPVIYFFTGRHPPFLLRIYLKKFNFKSQSSVGRNRAGDASGTISKIRRYNKFSNLAYLHS